MADIPIKKYRLRRARKWLKNKLMPFPVRGALVSARWRKPDRRSAGSATPIVNGDFSAHEYSWLSQNGEDGIVRYLFERIGFESRWLVEFGFGAKQCNALRLLVKEQFSGLLIDGSPENVNLFNFAARRLGIDGRARAVQAFITRDSLERLITSNGAPPEIDFLSLDVDGNDYWFWETLECVSPRVVCIEYNAGIGPDLKWTVPYDDEFQRFKEHPSGFFHGASLAALESLGRRKGYYLIGCDSTGTNAFFLRDDVRIDGVPPLTPGEAFRPHANWLGRGISEAEQLAIMRDLPYEEV